MAKAAIQKFITNDGTVRLASVISTDVIEEARKVHKSFPVPTAALGRSLIGAGLLASFLKEARVALHFKGDGPVGPIFAEADSHGNVRGYVTHSQVHVDSKNGKLNVGGGVGKGLLNVATSLPNQKHPYTGSVDIQTGEIGDDIAYYLFQSQQVPSIVALGVFVEPDNSVSAAGGTIVQAMPGVADQTLKVLEDRVKSMRPVTELILGGAKTEDLAFEVLEDLNFRKFEETVTMSYSCRCSKERVERALMLIGKAEIKGLIEKNEPAVVDCDFCGKQYSVGIEELKRLLDLSPA